MTGERKFSRQGKDKNACKVLAGKPDGRIPLVGPLSTFGSITSLTQEFAAMWTGNFLTQTRVQGLAVVHTVAKL